MIKKICFTFYYALIMHLPHSRYIRFMNKIRVFYVCNILGIMKKSKRARFQNNVYLGGPGAVSIGENCQINENVFLQGAIIGDNVMIAPNCVITNTDFHNPLVGKREEDGVEFDQDVVLHDGVWIGMNCTILKGVTIGENSIIAAGSVVSKDIPPNVIVGTHSLKILKKI